MSSACNRTEAENGLSKKEETEKERRKTTNIVLAGVGGQGVITAALLIGNAAVRSGLNVVMSELHGMSQRGGVVSVDLRIGDVHGPIIPDGEADLIIGFEAGETLRVMGKASRKTLVIMSSEKIVPTIVTIGDGKYPDIESVVSGLEGQGMNLHVFDTQGFAKEVGSALSSNLILVGAAYSSGLLPLDFSALEESVKNMFSPNSWAVNLKALKQGIDRFEASDTQLIRKEQVV